MIDLNELKRLAGLVTPGPLMAEEDPCDCRDYKVLVTTKGTRTFPGAWVMRAEHNWTDADYGERRISWKEAEANAVAVALLLSNLPTIITALEAAALVRSVLQILPAAKLDEVAASAVDWNGSDIPENEPAKWETEAGVIRDMVAEIRAYRAIIAALPKETDNAHD